MNFFITPHIRYSVCNSVCDENLNKEQNSDIKFMFFSGRYETWLSLLVFMLIVTYESIELKLHFVGTISSPKL